LASESLGVEGEPDGLNLNTGGLDKGGELVSLKVEKEMRTLVMLKKTIPHQMS
jgi:hypothetical protein